MTKIIFSSSTLSDGTEQWVPASKPTYSVSDRVCGGCGEPLLNRKDGLMTTLQGRVIGTEFRDDRITNPGVAYHYRCSSE